MNLLGIDVGSSSVKAAVLRDGRAVGKVVRAAFATDFRGSRVEVPANRVLKAVADAVGQLGAPARRVEAVGLSVMSPAWCAMDAKGKALTPLVTHQDRRSVGIALEIERRVGEERHLRLAGVRPFPGGVSSTTFAWYARHEPALVHRADLIGHLNTLLHRQMTGARVVDPSNASFMGLYATHDLSGWSGELCEAVRVPKGLLPEILESDRIAGRATAEAARRFGLTQGVPVMTGLMDGSSAMLLAGAKPGQMLNVCGSTDVLAVCADRFLPHEKLLTRALGVGGLWMSVSTIAAAGSALEWAKKVLFAEVERGAYRRLLRSVAQRQGDKERGRQGEGEKGGTVAFEPYLAGERTSIEQRTGGFSGLTLSTKREEMLRAVVDSLARASAERLEVFQSGGLKLRRRVVVSGGVQEGLDKILHRDWPGRWEFVPEDEATLRGLSMLRPRE